MKHKDNKILLDSISYFYDDQYLVEMANLQPVDTGMAYTVNVVSKGGAKHGPRVKVSNVPGRWAFDDNFSITLEPNPRVIGNCKIKSYHLDDIKDWIKLNHDHIHKIWNDTGTMSINDVANGFTKL